MVQSAIYFAIKQETSYAVDWVKLSVLRITMVSTAQNFVRQQEILCAQKMVKVPSVSPCNIHCNICTGIPNSWDTGFTVTPVRPRRSTFFVQKQLLYE